jgi:hypothetical protein
MIRLIIISLLTPLAALGADYALPAENQGYWTPHTAEPSPGSTPGVGVPGGFMRFTAGESEDRAVTGTLINVVTQHGIDNTGATDVTAALNAVISGTSPTSGNPVVIYLPDGWYRINGTLNIAHTKDYLTIRGAGSTRTFLVASGAETQNIGTVGVIGDGWTAHPVLTSAWQNVSGTKTKGTTTLNVVNASLFTVNRPGVIQLANEHDNTRIQAGAPPTYASFSETHARRWVFMVTDRNTTTNTITIDPPLLIDATDYAPQVVPGDSITSDIRYVGLESFAVIDGGGTSYTSGFNFGRAIYCWVYDTHFTYSDQLSSGYCVQFKSGFRNEVRKNTFVGNPPSGSIFGANPSFSDGAIEYSDQTSMLIEDNAFVSDLAANVAGWDVAIYSDGNISNSVHAYNFFEQSVKDISINHTGGHGILCLYEGNIGRAVQSDGYFTSTSHHTFWRNWFSGRNASGDANPATSPGVNRPGWFNRFTRNFALVGNVWGWDGTNSSSRPRFGDPNIGGEGSDNTAQPTLGDFWIDWAAYLAGTLNQTQPGLIFQEYDLDVEASFTIVHNYESSLTTGAVADSTADTLPASAFRSAKPSYFGSLAWPAINPDAPGFDPQAIPAAYRYYLTGEPPPSGATATITTLNATTLNIQ